MDKLTSIFLKPLEAILKAMTEPLLQLFKDGMFKIDNPFLNAKLVHKYDFFFIQGLKLLCIFFLINFILFLLSADFLEKSKFRRYYSESIIALVFLFMNRIFIIAINYIMSNLGNGVLTSPTDLSSFISLAVGGLAGAGVAMLSPFGIIVALVVGFLVFLLSSGNDMLAIMLNTMVMFSPIFVSMFAFNPFKKFANMFYMTYIGGHFVVMLQQGVIFVASAMVANASGFKQLSLTFASMVLMIFVIPMVMFKALSMSSRGVE